MEILTDATGSLICLLNPSPPPRPYCPPPRTGWTRLLVLTCCLGLCHTYRSRSRILCLVLNLLTADRARGRTQPQTALGQSGDEHASGRHLPVVPSIHRVQRSTTSTLLWGLLRLAPQNNVISLARGSVVSAKQLHLDLPSA